MGPSSLEPAPRPSHQTDHVLEIAVGAHEKITGSSTKGNTAAKRRSKASQQSSRFAQSVSSGSGEVLGLSREFTLSSENQAKLAMHAASSPGLNKPAENESIIRQVSRETVADWRVREAELKTAAATSAVAEPLTQPHVAAPLAVSAAAELCSPAMAEAVASCGSSHACHIIGTGAPAGASPGILADLSADAPADAPADASADAPADTPATASRTTSPWPPGTLRPPPRKKEGEAKPRSSEIKPLRYDQRTVYNPYHVPGFTLVKGRPPTPTPLAPPTPTPPNPGSVTSDRKSPPGSPAAGSGGQSGKGTRAVGGGPSLNSDQVLLGRASFSGSTPAHRVAPRPPANPPTRQPANPRTRQPAPRPTHLHLAHRALPPLHRHAPRSSPVPCAALSSANKLQRACPLPLAMQALVVTGPTGVKPHGRKQTAVVTVRCNICLVATARGGVG